MMRKKNILRGLFFLLVFCFVFNQDFLFAAGLSTTFSEVTLENLEIGKTYSTKEVANLPLEIRNTGAEAVDLKIELLLPQPEELKEGFEPVPSLDWIKLEETEFKGVKPGEAAITDVIIYIPDEEQYQGKKYQVFIWSHSVGRMIGVGLKSKLLLSILKNKEDTQP